jgi:hypothetical protein
VGFHVLARRDVGFGEPLGGQVAAPGRIVLAQVARDDAEVLIIGKVVASAAPGVKQPDPLAGRCIEQAAGGGEAFRSPRNRVPGVRDKGCAVEGWRVCFDELSMSGCRHSAPVRAP